MNQRFVRQLLIGLACGALLVAGTWLLDRIPVREKSPPTVEKAPAPPAPINFELLEATEPDEEYRPVYPETLDRLDGKRIVLNGFMTPYDDLESMKTFMVMGFPTGCNFCAAPSVNQVVLARQPANQNRYPYVDGPIQVTGRLKLWRPESTDPAHVDEYFLYILEDTEIDKLSDWEYQPPPHHQTPGHPSRQ